MRFTLEKLDPDERTSRRYLILEYLIVFAIGFYLGSHLL